LNTKTATPHIFPIVVHDGKRNMLKDFLYECGIETGIQYKPNHLLTKFYKGYRLPIAEKLYRDIVSIPLHPSLTDDNVYFIIDKIRKFFK
jgi:dTDP-4-amino-4,6-dideoxygalactose transaminase